MYWREAKERLLQVCPSCNLFTCLLAENLFVLSSGAGVLSLMAPPFHKVILIYLFIFAAYVYKGGYYYGKIKFPPEYPFKPPGIRYLCSLKKLFIY